MYSRNLFQTRHHQQQPVRIERVEKKVITFHACIITGKYKLNQCQAFLTFLINITSLVNQNTYAIKTSLVSISWQKPMHTHDTIKCHHLLTINLHTIQLFY